VGRPWGGIIDACNLVITGNLGETTVGTERCIHTIVLPEDREQLLTIQFEWQRKFKTARQISKSNLEEALEDGQKSALKYFEDLAEGSRFDEILINTATTT
jgi:hypothetical protein